MANFVEQATLVVKDQSTAQINKINKALKELQRTARSLKNVKVDIRVGTNDVQKAIAALRRLNAAINSVKTNGRNLNIGGGSAGTRSAQNAVRGLARQMQALNTQNAAASHAQLRNMQRQAFLARQTARYQQQAAAAGGGGTGGGGRGGGGRGGGGRGGGGLGGALRTVGRIGGRSGSGLTAGLTGIGVGLGGATVYSALAAAGRAAREGLIDADVGKMSLNHKQLGPLERRYADQLIEDIGKDKDKLPGGQFLNLAQRQLSFSEALGATQGSMPGAQALTSRLEETTMSLVALGKGFEEAQEQAISFGKGFSQMGRMSDPRTGEFDLTRMTSSFDYITKLMPTIGKEFTGTFFRNITKYLGATKFAISDRALGAVMMLGEETGTRAAVGYGQAVKQFSGIGVTKQAMAEQAAFGLREVTQVGKKKVYGNVVDQKLLQEDLPAWINEYVVKKMEALDPGSSGDPQKVMDRMQRLLSHGTARETGAAFAYRSQEMQKDLDIIDMRSGDVETQRKINAQSVAVAGVGLQNSFQSMTGQFLMAYQKPMVTYMDKAKAQMNELATDFTKEGGVPDETTMLKAAGILIGSGAVLGTGMLAMQNPATAALGAAGISLMGAAAALLTSADALGVAGGLTPEQVRAGKSTTAAEQAGTKASGLSPSDYNTAMGRRATVERNLAALNERLAAPEDVGKGFGAKKADELRRNYENNLRNQILELGKELAGLNSNIQKYDEARDEEKVKQDAAEAERRRRITPEEVAKEKADRAAAFKQRAATYDVQQSLARQRIGVQTVKRVDWPTPKKSVLFTKDELAGKFPGPRARPSQAEIDRNTNAWTLPKPGSQGAPKIPLDRSARAITLAAPLIKAANPVFEFTEQTPNAATNRFIAGAHSTIAGQIALGGIPLPGVTTAPPGATPEEDKATKITSAIELGFGQGSSTAVSTLIAGSETAGSALGSAAVNAIHAGVSDLTINVTANVVGTTGGDKGGNSVSTGNG